MCQLWGVMDRHVMAFLFIGGNFTFYHYKPCLARSTRAMALTSIHTLHCNLYVLSKVDIF